MTVREYLNTLRFGVTAFGYHFRIFPVLPSRESVSISQFAAKVREYLEDLADEPEADEIALAWVEREYVIARGVTA